MATQEVFGASGHRTTGLVVESVPNYLDHAAASLGRDLSAVATKDLFLELAWGEASCAAECKSEVGGRAKAQ